MSTPRADAADFRFPAKKVKFLKVLRYDGPNSRRPGSLATRAHNLDHHVVKWLGWSYICWLFQPRAAGHRREPAILVRNIRARTGILREAVLTAFTEDSGARIVAATNGGLRQQPAWVTNLRKSSARWVKRRFRTYPAIAEELVGEDKGASLRMAVPALPRALAV
jgi:hypothetical protein